MDYNFRFRNKAMQLSHKCFCILFIMTIHMITVDSAIAPDTT